MEALAVVRDPGLVEFTFVSGKILPRKTAMREPTCFCTLETPLGKAIAGAEEDAVTGFWFVGQKYYPKNAGSWRENPEYPVFSLLRSWLAEYFAGKCPQAAVPLKPHGTPFQRGVWNILLHIPYGQLTTYGHIAAKMAAARNLATMSAQAVGGAVGHNPISVLIPCHRVVGSSGKLTGYAGGLDKKEALLRLEGAMDTSKNLRPRAVNL